MKRTVFFSILFLAVSALYAQKETETDLALFNELSAAYSSGFYPGAVEYADRLESAYPDSVFTGRMLVMKGESLVRLGRSSDAEPVLSQAERLNKNNPDLTHACSYWEGRARYAQKKYGGAAQSFYDSCKITGTGGRYYSSAVLYGGRSLYALGSYSESVSPFEYVVSNGKKYSGSDYEEAVLKLADACNRTNAYGKTISLFDSFSAGSLSADGYALFSVYTGDAYYGLKQYRKAYDLYSAVLESGQKKFAAGALKKAYAVSSEHRNEVGTDAGAVLAQAQHTLSGSPELVSEFWMRLGIDAYNQNNFSRAKQYFDSADASATDSMKQTMALYRAEMLLGDTDAAHAYAFLEKAEQAAHLEEKDSSYDMYASLMLKYAALQGEWETVKAYEEKIKTPAAKTQYYTALAYYNTAGYAGAAGILGKMINSGSGAEVPALYARSLVKINKIQDALSVFAGMDSSGKMDDISRLDYAETLLLSGQYAAAYEQARKSSEPEALYTAGLAAFNSREWGNSEDCFTKYGRTVPGSGKYQQYALFYLGYSQYKLGKNGAAYAVLSGFAEKYPGNELCWNAHMTAANAAVQDNKYVQAAAQASEAVKTAPDAPSLERAVLFCSGVYSDSGNYTEALSILSPYTAQKNRFGMKCAYETAQIFVKQGELEKADNAYLKIARDYPAEDLAEESMYRRGEIYYTAKQYDAALSRFGEYEKQYPLGKYTDASWYFSADCQAQKGNVSRAILQNAALIKEYPGSTYIYGARKNLMLMYRRTDDYADALAQARSLLSEYGDQARSDGIAKQAAELEKLVSGSSEPLVKKQSEYEQKGRLSTEEGRRAGTELAAMYGKSDSTLQQGAELAAQLLAVEKQHLDEESADAAENADIIALYDRRTGKNKESADMYLFAAKYYRMNGMNDDAASALYNAADAFRAAGRDGDADATIKTLVQLYPESRQAKSIDSSGR